MRNAKTITVDININGRKVREARIPESQWPSINCVHYIEIDTDGRLSSEFMVHDFPARLAMQNLAS